MGTKAIRSELAMAVAKSSLHISTRVKRVFLALTSVIVVSPTIQVDVRLRKAIHAYPKVRPSAPYTPAFMGASRNKVVSREGSNVILRVVYLVAQQFSLSDRNCATFSSQSLPSRHPQHREEFLL